MMAPEERILTLHPDPAKNGVRISRAQYHLVRAAILDVLHAAPTVTLNDLIDRVDETLAGHLDGSITWYVIAVKQDLEARRLIEQIPRVTPQRLRLVAAETMMPEGATG